MPTLRDPYPRQQVFKFRYNSNFILTPPDEKTNVIHGFIANNCADPEEKGGSPPLGFSRYVTALYGSNFTIKSRIRVRAISVTSGTGPAYWGVFTTNTAPSTISTTTGLDVFESQPYGTWRLQQVAINGNVPLACHAEYNCHTWFGIKRVEDAGDQEVVGTTDPTTPAYFAVWCRQPIDTTPEPMYFTVTIDYTVVMSRAAYLNS